MRLATLLLFLAAALPSPSRAEEHAWPGVGTIRLTVPPGWSQRSQASGDASYLFLIQPRQELALVLQLSILSLPPDKAVPPGAEKGMLERIVQPVLAGSVEKAAVPRPMAVAQGKGWVVQFTDASLVGKPPEPGNYKVMRNALVAIDDRMLAIATLQFDDESLPEVGQAMAVVASVRVERAAAAREAREPGSAFDFTVPQSRVLVRIPAIGLHPDADGAGRPGYFKLSRERPMLIVSGWLEPADAYKGLEAFWEEERRSPAYQGALAPQHVKLTRVGRWEVVSYDIPLDGGVSAHLRAQRVQAGTWIDLHLSSTQAREGEQLREELLSTLRTVEVVEKAEGGR
jgi:hypothetical protein